MVKPAVQMTRRISILGVTGSVGASTRDVVAQMRSQGEDISVVAVTAGSNVQALAEAAVELRAAFAAVSDESKLGELKALLSGTGVSCGGGQSAIVEAAERNAELVMSAIVGAAGLRPTLAAIRRGATIALANKECLVSAGEIMMREARANSSTILPVDSEHNAVFQVLTHPASVARITLTGSGGPFRTWETAQIERASPSDALKHPTWSMGPKITIDSATLMNKGLELIEAAMLFDLPAEKIDVVIHPQSVIHALVHYCDGAVLAQMSSPDMRVPIASALAHPVRTPTNVVPLDLIALAKMTFEKPDHARFPAINIARNALAAGGGMTAVLNAANEVAVDSFLDGRLRFMDITSVCSETLQEASSASIAPPQCVDDVYEIDQWARSRSRAIVSQRVNA
jgi:1-deoxy-D-xylulose-5-phosphate reductoisomerase